MPKLNPELHREVQAYLDEMQSKLDDENGQETAFAIGVFDCDNLKLINDKYGHEKGDIYLKTASRLICRIFQHSPVFRIGGDEFSVVLQNDDLMNRDVLTERFRRSMEEISAAADNDWEQVHVAMGIAVYDPKYDRNVNEVVRRADQIMYENKRVRKKGSMR